MAAARRRRWRRRPARVALVGGLLTSPATSATGDGDRGDGALPSADEVAAAESAAPTPAYRRRGPQPTSCWPTSGCARRRSRAAQAAEAFNAARYQLSLAREEARRADLAGAAAARRPRPAARGVRRLARVGVPAHPRAHRALGDRPTPRGSAPSWTGRPP